MGDYRNLDFEVLREKLDNLFTAMANKVEREWPERLASAPGAQPMVLALVKVCHLTYLTVKSLCTDKSADPYHRPEYALAALPLARTLADALSSLVLLFNDPDTNARWYWASGWREIHEHYDLCKKEYGIDPAWSSWFEAQEHLLRNSAAEWGVTKEQQADPSSIRYWPLPGRALKQQSLPVDSRDFLQYLNEWFYRMLSSASHLSAPGLLLRAGPLLPHDDHEQRDQDLDKARSDFLFTTVTLAIAVLSEVEAGTRFDLADRARYIWGVLVEFWGPTREVYDRRYKRLLQAEDRPHP